jgi:hypothetical protein
VVKELLHDVLRDVRVDNPGVPVDVGVQVADPGALPQPAEQLAGAVPRHRRAPGLARQGDEHVVAVQHPVLKLHVVGVEVEHDIPDRDGPLLHPLNPRLVGVVLAGNDADLGAAQAQVLVPQPQRLADPQPGLVQQAHQEPVPGPRARRRHPRVAAGVEPVEPGQRSPLAHQRAVLQPLRTARQREHARRPGRRRAPQPVKEVRDLLQGHRPPVQPGLPRPGEEVPEVVRVRLDGVRRRRHLQAGKVRLRRPDRQGVIAQQRVRNPARAGQAQPLHRKRHPPPPSLDQQPYQAEHV